MALVHIFQVIVRDGCEQRAEDVKQSGHLVSCLLGLHLGHFAEENEQRLQQRQTFGTWARFDFVKDLFQHFQDPTRL